MRFMNLTSVILMDNKIMRGRIQIVIKLDLVSVEGQVY